MKTASLLLALTLAACSSLDVASDYDDRVDFSRLSTWAWRGRAKRADPLSENTLVSNRVRDAIERVLAAKGYRPATDGTPDFVVDFATSSRQRVYVRPGMGWPSRRRWGGPWRDTEVFDYLEGTLLVGVLDPARDELIWRGVATRDLDSESGGQAAVDEIVHALLAQFPPR
jgi:hypothetical protein